MTPSHRNRKAAEGFPRSVAWVSKSQHAACGVYYSRRHSFRIYRLYVRSATRLLLCDVLLFVDIYLHLPKLTYSRVDYASVFDTVGRRQFPAEH